MQELQVMQVLQVFIMMFANKDCAADIVQVWQMGPKWWGSRIGKSIPQIVAVHTLEKLEKFTLEKSAEGLALGKAFCKSLQESHSTLLKNSLSKKVVEVPQIGEGAAFQATFRKFLQPSPTTFWHLPHLETSDKSSGVKHAESESICEQIRRLLRCPGLTC